MTEQQQVHDRRGLISDPTDARPSLLASNNINSNNNNNNEVQQPHHHPTSTEGALKAPEEKRKKQENRTDLPAISEQQNNQKISAADKKTTRKSVKEGKKEQTEAAEVPTLASVLNELDSRIAELCEVIRLSSQQQKQQGGISSSCGATVASAGRNSTVGDAAAGATTTTTSAAADFSTSSRPQLASERGSVGGGKLESPMLSLPPAPHSSLASLYKVSLDSSSRSVEFWEMLSSKQKEQRRRRRRSPVPSEQQQADVKKKSGLTTTTATVATMSSSHQTTSDRLPLEKKEEEEEDDDELGLFGGPVEEQEDHRETTIFNAARTKEDKKVKDKDENMLSAAEKQTQEAEEEEEYEEQESEDSVPSMIELIDYIIWEDDCVKELVAVNTFLSPDDGPLVAVGFSQFKNSRQEEPLSDEGDMEAKMGTFRSAVLQMLLTKLKKLRSSNFDGTPLPFLLKKKNKNQEQYNRTTTTSKEIVEEILAGAIFTIPLESWQSVLEGLLASLQKDFCAVCDANVGNKRTATATPVEEVPAETKPKSAFEENQKYIVAPFFKSRRPSVFFFQRLLGLCHQLPNALSPGGEIGVKENLAAAADHRAGTTPSVPSSSSSSLGRIGYLSAVKKPNLSFEHRMYTNSFSKVSLNPILAQRFLFPEDSIEAQEDPPTAAQPTRSVYTVPTSKFSYALNPAQNKDSSLPEETGVAHTTQMKEEKQHQNSQAQQPSTTEPKEEEESEEEEEEELCIIKLFHAVDLSWLAAKSLFGKKEKGQTKANKQTIKDEDEEWVLITPDQPIRAAYRHTDELEYISGTKRSCLILLDLSRIHSTSNSCTQIQHAEDEAQQESNAGILFQPFASLSPQKANIDAASREHETKVPTLQPDALAGLIADAMKAFVSLLEEKEDCESIRIDPFVSEEKNSNNNNNTMDDAEDVNEESTGGYGAAWRAVGEYFHGILQTALNAPPLPGKSQQLSATHLIGAPGSSGVNLLPVRTNSSSSLLRSHDVPVGGEAKRGHVSRQGSTGSSLLIDASPYPTRSASNPPGGMDDSPNATATTPVTTSCRCVLIGEAGSGKSTVLFHLLEHIARRFPQVVPLYIPFRAVPQKSDVDSIIQDLYHLNSREFRSLFLNPTASASGSGTGAQHGGSTTSDLNVINTPSEKSFQQQQQQARRSPIRPQGSALQSPSPYLGQHQKRHVALLLDAPEESPSGRSALDFIRTSFAVSHAKFVFLCVRTEWLHACDIDPKGILRPSSSITDMSSNNKLTASKRRNRTSDTGSVTLGSTSLKHPPSAAGGGTISSAGASDMGSEVETTNTATIPCRVAFLLEKTSKKSDIEEYLKKVCHAEWIRFFREVCSKAMLKARMCEIQRQRGGGCGEAGSVVSLSPLPSTQNGGDEEESETPEQKIPDPLSSISQHDALIKVDKERTKQLFTTVLKALKSLGGGYSKSAENITSSIHTSSSSASVTTASSLLELKEIKKHRDAIVDYKFNILRKDIDAAIPIIHTSEEMWLASLAHEALRDRMISSEESETGSTSNNTGTNNSNVAVEVPPPPLSRFEIFELGTRALLKTRIEELSVQTQKSTSGSLSYNNHNGTRRNGRKSQSVVKVSGELTPNAALQEEEEGNLYIPTVDEAIKRGKEIALDLIRRRTIFFHNPPQKWQPADSVLPLRPTLGEEVPHTYSFQHGTFLRFFGALAMSELSEVERSKLITEDKGRKKIEVAAILTMVKESDNTSAFKHLASLKNTVDDGGAEVALERIAKMDLSSLSVSQRFHALNFKAHFLAQAKKHAEAARIWEKLLADPSHQDSVKNNRQQEQIMMDLANSYGESNQYQKEKNVLSKLAPLVQDKKERRNQGIFVQLKLKYAEACHSLGEWNEERKILKQLIPLLEELRGPEHFDTASAYLHWGLACQQLALHEEAVIHLGKSVEIAEKGGLGKSTQVDTKFLMQSLKHLSLSYEALQNFAETKNTLEKLLPILQQEYGAGHLTVAQLLKRLAAAYRGLGDFWKNRVLLEQALPVYREQSNSAISQKEIFDIIKEIAYCHDLEGNYAEVVTYLEEALSLLEELLEVREDSKHCEEYVCVLLPLAHGYAMTNHFEEQRNTIERLLKIEQLHGPKKSGIKPAQLASLLYDLAVVSYHLPRCKGSGENAEKGNSEGGEGGLHPNRRKELLTRAISLFQESVGRQDPRTGDAWYELGMVSAILGDLETERMAFEKVIPIYRKHFGTLHLQYGKALFRLGEMYEKGKEYHRTVKALEHALPVFQQSVGSSHVDTGRLLLSLGRAHGHLQNHVEQQECLQKALSIFEQNKNNEEKEEEAESTVSEDLLIETKALLGCNAYELHDFVFSRKMLENVIEPLKEKWEGDELVRPIFILAKVCHALRDPTYEKKYLLEALQRQEEKHGTAGLQVGEILYMLGEVCATLGEQREQLDFLKRALPILEGHLGSRDTKVGDVLTSIGEAYGYFGQCLQQQSFLKRAFAAYSTAQFRPSQRRKKTLAAASMRLGLSHGMIGEYTEQKKLLQKGVALLTDSLSESLLSAPQEDTGATRELALGQCYLAKAHLDLREIVEARELLEKNIPILLPLLSSSSESEEPPCRHKCGATENVNLLPVFQFTEAIKAKLNLASAMGAQKEFMEQRREVETVISLLKAHPLFITRHYAIYPLFGIALVHLGSVLSTLDDLELARTNADDGLKILVDFYGEKHVEVTAAKLKVSAVRGALGDKEEQNRLLEEAMPLLKEQYGDGHPIVSSVLTHLAEVNERKRNFLKEKELLELALSNEKEYHAGKENGEIASLQVKLGSTYLRLEDTETAKRYFENALKHAPREYQPAALLNHPPLIPTAGSHHHVAPAITTSLQKSDSCNSDGGSWFLPLHEVAIALSQLGCIYGAEGQYRAQVFLQETALKILAEVRGSMHPDIGFTLAYMSKAYGAIGDTTKERSSIERSLSILNSHVMSSELQPNKEEERKGASTTTANSSSSHGKEVLGTLLRGAGFYNSVHELSSQKKCLDQAEDVCKQFYPQEEEETEGEGRVQWAILRTSMSSFYGALKNFQKQKELCENACAIFEKDLGGNHPHTARGWECLADAYGSLGDTDRQKELLEKSLEVFSLRLGAQHPEVARILIKLSDVYGGASNKQFAKQRDVLEQALPIEESRLGENSLEVARILVKLSYSFAKNREYADQKATLKRALDIFLYWNEKEEEKKKQRYDSEIVPLYLELGNTYANLGEDVHNQLYCLEQALEIAERYYGPKHEDVGVVLLNLAGLYGKEQDVALQQEALERALQIFEEKLKWPHPRTATCFALLAEVHGARGNLQKQGEMIERALSAVSPADVQGKKEKKRKKMKSKKNKNQEEGPTFPPDSVAVIHFQAGIAKESAGEYHLAKAYFKKALASMECAHDGEDHIQLASILLRLGQVYGWLDKKTRQRTCLQRGLAIEERHYDSTSHPELIPTLLSLAGASAAVRDFAQQKNYLKRALDIHVQHFGPDDPELVSIYRNLGNCCGSMKDYTKKLEYLSEALRIEESVYGPQHIRVSRILLSLAETYHRLGQEDEKVKMLERANAMLEARCGSACAGFRRQFYHNKNRMKEEVTGSSAVDVNIGVWRVTAENCGTRNQ